MRSGKSDTTESSGQNERTWPAWAKVTVTLTLLFHSTAIFAAAWGAEPSSRLEREVRNAFRWYYDLIDQGYTYRFYSEPPPTPVTRAVIRFDDGHTEEVRIPDRHTQPRLRYQRELALANWLREDAERARSEGGKASLSRWAQSYARHLGKTHPGAVSVTLSIEMHLIPDPERIRHQWAETGTRPDLDDPNQDFTVPERIGEFSCDAS